MNISRAIEYNEEIEQKQYELDKVLRATRRWRYFAVFWLFVLIVILLYACGTVMRQSAPVELPTIKYYNATFRAEMIDVDSNKIGVQTTEDLLSESADKGYISNCLEFYFDGEKYDMRDGSTKYYSIADLDAEIIGSDLSYQLVSFDEGVGSASVTEVVSREFVYGFNDGSCQMVSPEDGQMVFSGYSKALVDGYMAQAEKKYCTQEPVTLVISGSYEVTEAFINALLGGVLKDSYSPSDASASSFYYGLYSDGAVVEYINSKGQRIDIAPALESNIEAYLNQDVTIQYSIPEQLTEDITVVYLSSENYLYDNFYIANELGLY